MRLQTRRGSHLNPFSKDLAQINNSTYDKTMSSPTLAEFKKSKQKKIETKNYRNKGDNSYIKPFELDNNPSSQFKKMNNIIERVREEEEDDFEEAKQAAN
jgi:hypothetical protein